jgi:hypothetical protein
MRGNFACPLNAPKKFALLSSSLNIYDPNIHVMAANPQHSLSDTSAFSGTDSHNLLDRCRDSAPSFGNCLKLRGTDGYQNRALEPRVTIIGP